MYCHFNFKNPTIFKSFLLEKSLLNLLVNGDFAENMITVSIKYVKSCGNYIFKRDLFLCFFLLLLSLRNPCIKAVCVIAIHLAK